MRESPGPVSGPVSDTAREALLELREVMRRLRAECPWKREQTHRSLVRYLVEELHETVDAVESGGPDDLREELGDLLLQVYFHAAIAEESGAFTVDDVAAGIVAKMVRRNPHVFGDGGQPRAPHTTAAEVNELWESVKASEKQRTTITDGIAPTLPALLYADKVLDRLGRAGRRPELTHDTLGDRLLVLVAEAHDVGADPEQELRDAVRRLLV